MDGFFLAYDVKCSGGFPLLGHIPNGGAKVVSGVVTSKSGVLEYKEKIKARIHEAAQYGAT